MVSHRNCNGIFWNLRDQSHCPLVGAKIKAWAKTHMDWFQSNPLDSTWQLLNLMEQTPEALTIWPILRGSKNCSVITWLKSSFHVIGDWKVQAIAEGDINSWWWGKNGTLWSNWLCWWWCEYITSSFSAAFLLIKRQLSHFFLSWMAGPCRSFSKLCTERLFRFLTIAKNYRLWYLVYITHLHCLQIIEAPIEEFEVPIRSACGGLALSPSANRPWVLFGRFCSIVVWADLSMQFIYFYIHQYIYILNRGLKVEVQSS